MRTGSNSRICTWNSRQTNRRKANGKLTCFRLYSRSSRISFRSFHSSTTCSISHNKLADSSRRSFPLFSRSTTTTPLPTFYRSSAPSVSPPISISHGQTSGCATRSQSGRIKPLQQVRIDLCELFRSQRFSAKRSIRFRSYVLRTLSVISHQGGRAEGSV